MADEPNPYPHNEETLRLMREARPHPTQEEIDKARGYSPRHLAAIQGKPYMTRDMEAAAPPELVAVQVPEPPAPAPAEPVPPPVEEPVQDQEPVKHSRRRKSSDE